jgi:hypothetical protein
MDCMSTTAAVVVYGATGHTGRFIVAELRRRGIATVISGRDAARLAALAAEIEANAAMFADHAAAARPVMPAMAFYGGLGDLLVTAAMGEWTAADEVHVAYGLSSWHPTAGTRAAGQVSHERRAGRRVRFTDGALQYHDDKAVEQDWLFPEPLGRRAVIAEFTMADVVTVPSHLAVPEVRTYMTVEAARDLA